VAAFGRPVDVITSAELDALVLSTDAAPFLNTTYNKIIVPSDQPRALYEALVRNTEKLERFVDYGGMLEIHGATRAADDWSDLRLPGGIRCAVQDGTNAHDTLAPYGYPLLPDVVASAPYLWDFEPHMGLPGDRPFDEAETALERLGWWVSQNLTWNIQEKMCWKRGAVYTRYLLPQDIVFYHFGNCGEIQDLWTGGGRTLLVGIWGVGTIADDHMWNEFWQGDQYLPLQVDWSDNDTRIGNWGVAYDADTGGSKTIAGMDAFRGDGLMDPALGRYADTELDGHLWNDYSHHVTLEATVVDNDGNPVDGAQVMLATAGLYDPAALSVAAWQATGPDGVARLTVGEGNDYYVQVNSSLGSYPDATHVDRWLTAAETVADGVFADTFTLDTVLAPPTFSVVPATGEVSGRAAATISVSREIVLGKNAISGEAYATQHSYPQPYDSGDVQALLMTESAYTSFAAGGGFATVAAGQRGRDLALDEELLGNGPFVLVVANQARVATEEQTSIHFELWGPEAADAGDGEDVVEDGLDDVGDVPDEGGPIIDGVNGGGCGCRTTRTTGHAAGWLATLALVFVLRNRRRA
jgi:MYXO-CTERM domain-containing protein